MTVFTFTQTCFNAQCRNSIFPKHLPSCNNQFNYNLRQKIQNFRIQLKNIKQYHFKLQNYSVFNICLRIYYHVIDVDYLNSFCRTRREAFNSVGYHWKKSLNVMFLTGVEQTHKKIQNSRCYNSSSYKRTRMLFFTSPRCIGLILFVFVRLLQMR